MSMTHVEQISPNHVGAMVGYARTSTADQRAGLEAQIAELHAHGCTRVFSEHCSGVDRARPQLHAALDWVRAGDVFVVTKPERLARSVTDLLGIVAQLRERGVAVRVLAMGLDTREATPTTDLFLALLGCVGAWERSVMLERQRIGIAKAKTLGKYRGRAPTARAKATEVIRLKSEGKTIREIIDTTGVSRASVYRAFNTMAPA